MTNMLKNHKIGILGFGRMGSAIADGLISGGFVAEIYTYDPLHSAHSGTTQKNGIRFLSSPQELEKTCDLILLAVKPQNMGEALKSYKGDKQYITIAAGLSIEKIEKFFPEGANPKIARAMPNISATVGKGVSGIYCSDKELLEICLNIFNSIGFAVEIKEERLMHAVTALSGSGPAYVFAFLQGLAEGGVLCGLPYQTSLELAAHTLIGAAEMCMKTGEHPSVLRNRVTSPGGTTIAGLKALEEDSFQGTIMRAVEKAAERSRELGS